MMLKLADVRWELRLPSSMVWLERRNVGLNRAKSSESRLEGNATFDGSFGAPPICRVIKISDHRKC
jgi:hypothetical protein